MARARLAYVALGLALSFGCSSSDDVVPYESSASPERYGTHTSLDAVDVSPPDGHASDDWLESQATPWSEEVARREAGLRAYLGDTDSERADAYGFRSGHTPALAWNWFEEHPIGYGGLPYVLLQTILSLDPGTETDPHLLEIARIWKKPSSVAAEQGQATYTLDQLGFGPHPLDYEDGVAKSPDQRRRLPNGFVYDPGVLPDEVWWVDARLRVMRDGVIGSLIRRIDRDYTPKLARLLVLARGKLRREIYGGELDYEIDHARFQEPPKTDAVFFSCTGCHQGRVIVGGRLDREGNIRKAGRVKLLPGMPNTEVEAQAFSKLLMETGMALIEEGYSLDATALPTDPDQVVPSTPAILALYTRMLSRALDPQISKTIYGPTPDQVRRAKLQTYWVAKDFPTYAGSLIGVAIKTQYLYYQVGRTYAYNPKNPRRAGPTQKVPDVLTGHIGQMDAFGAASGLVALHTLREDNSFIEFAYRDNPASPLFAGFPDAPGFVGAVGPEKAGERIRNTVSDWAPPVPAPIDIPSVSWTGHRVLANWDGNQGAAARALSSGTSATGDPRKVNVKIHEPFNPLMSNLPPVAYPFSVDRDRALRGKRLFEGDGVTPDESCAGCHSPRNGTVYPANRLGVDANRSLVTTDVSRYGLAVFVKETCSIFMRKNPGNDWCLPKDDSGRAVTDWDEATNELFMDTPGRVRRGENGYKANMLHGIWAQAPYLHNGSVPTLMHLICPDTRPARFKRGVLFYDRAMVGFEWELEPRQRYSQHETQWVRDYDTSELSRGNRGHAYGSSLCPDTRGLDPVADREVIVDRLLASRVGDLLEYLKTF